MQISHNVVGALAANNVTYFNTRYLIQAQDDIKINGVTFNQNDAIMKKINFEAIKAKMDRHFTEWSYNNKTCCLNGVRFLSNLLIK